MQQGVTIQGVAPGTVERVNDADAAARIIRDCAEAGRAIVDYGPTAATTGMGHAPPADHLQLQLPDGIIEHGRADMMVRVHANTTFADLDAALHEANQWLPIDARHDQTVGQIIAHNLYGPLRLGFGAMRDILLGLSYLDAAGRRITVGGQTVKNVAGYDMTRFMVGQMNTLGLIDTATLRTWARPEQITQVRVADVSPAHLDAAMTPLLTGDATPAAAVLSRSDESNKSNGFTLTVSYLGVPHGCDAQVAALEKWAGEQQVTGGETPAMHRTDTPFDEYLTAARGEPDWREQTTGVVKLIVPIRRTGAVAQTVHREVHPDAHLDALPAHGVIWCGGDWSITDGEARHDTFRRLVEAERGVLQWVRRPDDTPTIPPHAPEPSDAATLRAIEQALDPQRVFNPGRLFASDG